MLQSFDVKTACGDADSTSELQPVSRVSLNGKSIQIPYNFKYRTLGRMAGVTGIRDFSEHI